MPDVSSLQSPVIFVELRRANGTVSRIAGADATTFWHGVIRAMDVAQVYGVTYTGPKLAVVPAAPANPSEVAPALEDAPGPES